MKRLIVVVLEKICNMLDKYVIEYLPLVAQMHWHHKPAMLSLDLDDKWQTGVWK